MKSSLSNSQSKTAGRYQFDAIRDNGWRRRRADGGYWKTSRPVNMSRWWGKQSQHSTSGRRSRGGWFSNRCKTVLVCKVETSARRGEVVRVEERGKRAWPVWERVRGQPVVTTQRTYL